MTSANSSQTFDHNSMFLKMGIGSLGFYNSYTELTTLMTSLTQQFPECVRKFQIGSSYQNRPIYGYLIGLGLTSKNLTMPKPKLLITGAHHAREQSTVSMCVYTVLRLLYQYVHQDPETLYIFNNAAIVVVPVINVDGFKQISDNYMNYGNWSYTRKNLHQYSFQSTCDTMQQSGVDLQRNYGFNFGLDDVGSSSDPCSDNYRGPAAFS